MSEYTSKDIKLLSERDHCRLRPGMYVGNMNPTEYKIPCFKAGKFTIETMTFVPAILKCVNEILDNSWDELLQHNRNNKKITIIADPENADYTIADNGRGIPIDMHESGRPTPEVALTSLRAGRNFTDGKDAGVIGMNGIGSSAVSALSSMLEVEIHRDNKRYQQRYLDGALVIEEPVIKRAVGVDTGTLVHFTLDPTLFPNLSLPNDLVRNRAIEIAFSNSDLLVEYNLEEFSYKRGFALDVLTPLSKKFHTFNGPFGEFHVCFDLHQSISEQIFTWVNSSLLFDGGICNTQFYNAFIDKVVEHLGPAAKKAKIEVTSNDIRRDLLIFGNLRIQDPQYDAQSKTRLTGPNLKKDYVKAVEDGWKGFTRQHKDWLELVLERATRRFKNAKDKDATEEFRKKSKKVEGLLDATSKNRQKCKLLICEGLSASGTIGDVRDPEFVASFALTGKFNNVFESSVADLLNMGKLKDMLAACGLVPGQKATRQNLNFGQIIIATDADYDGGNIFTNAINLFYKFWPELLDPKIDPVIYRMVAPNVCAVKGNKRLHFASRSKFEENKHLLKGYTIKFYKGLGSMDREDWEMLLSNQTESFIPIQDEEGMLGATLELIFGPDSDARKEWLSAT